MTITIFAATLFSLVAAGVTAFQLALALGAPWGRFAMGGAFPGTFPPAMRGAAVVQALIIVLFGVIVLARADVALLAWKSTSLWAIWIVVAFSGVSIALNAISPSAGERTVWVPVAIVMLACSLTVALAKGGKI